jgi:hypothetical protein
MARARLALRDLHKAGQDRHDDVAVPGKAYVDEFTPDGRLVARVVNDGKKNAPLNAPWGLARAPSDFGIFGGDLLVGNFGNGRRSFFGGTWPTRPSKPDPVSPLERATSSADPHSHDCGHEAPHAAGVARSEERVRPRTQLASRGRAKTGECVAASAEGDRDATAELLRHVAAVGHRREQDTDLAVPAHAKA